MAVLVHTAPLPSAALVQALRRADPTTPVWSEQDSFDPDRVEAMLAWRLKPGIVGRYPNLRVVCSIGAGVEKVLRATDLPAHVSVTRVIDPAQAQAIAAYVLACALPFARDFATYRTHQERAEWLRRATRSIDRCRVGILGQGQIAQAIAGAFTAVGFPVSVWGRSPREWPHWSSFAGVDQLPAMLARSDILVCTLPMTPETQGLVDRERLAMMPRGAFLVSVGRGGVVVEEHLRQALDDGQLAGAALDVFEREPLPPDHWLWRDPRVLVTPHVAGESAPEVVAAACLEALRCARKGLPQPAAVDRGRGY